MDKNNYPLPINDPFCEARYWIDLQGNPPLVTNPICMATGLCMVFLPLIPNGDANNKASYPALFVTSKAMMVLVGVGTVIFHAIELQPLEANGFLSVRGCDWYPIVLMALNLLLLYISDWMFHETTELISTLAFFVLASWAAALLLCMDTSTQVYWANRWMQGAFDRWGMMWNIILLLPLLAVLLWNVFVVRRHRLPLQKTYMLWFWLGCSILLWVLCSALCEKYHILFLLHAVYHLTIAMGYITAACVGVCLQDHRRPQYDLRYSFRFWPVLVEIFDDNTHDTKPVMKGLDVKAMFQHRPPLIPRLHWKS